MADIHDFEPLWGSWTIEGNPLGAGGSGITYKARRNLLGYTSYCAIKHISVPSGVQQLVQARDTYNTDDDEQLHAHFEAEIKDRMKEYASQSIFANNRHIVQVYDVLNIEKKPHPGFDLFIRMELLNALNKKLNMKTVDEQTVIRLGLDICDALKEMHGKNVIHRDIKPQNILVADDGTFKLADFGSIRVLDNGATTMTQNWTPTYAAPELLKNEKADHRVDLYSLGLVLYQLSNEGKLPFSSGLINLGGKLEAPARVSQGLAEVIIKACAYKPEDRWQTAEEMGRALEACLETGGEGKEIPPTRIEKKPNDRLTYLEETLVFYRTEINNPLTGPALELLRKQIVAAGDTTEAKKLLVQCNDLMTIHKLLNGQRNTPIPPGVGKDVEKTQDSQPTTRRVADLTKYKVGSTVTFGRYPQTEAENDQTPIEWQVLAREGNSALLISRYGLDSKPYNEQDTDVTWEPCTLRDWLNNEFINAAFTPAQQNGIETRTVDNRQAQGASRSVDGGKNTQDKVFLLSYAEAEKYFANDEARKCIPTAYAVKNGTCQFDGEAKFKLNGQGCCWWWLRTHSQTSSFAACVNVDGAHGHHSKVNNSGAAVRPALWINLESLEP